MAEILSSIMGGLDIVVGIILLTTSTTLFMIFGGLIIGKGVISFF